MNPAILATMVKQSTDDQYSINWYKLHLPGEPEEGHFYNFLAFEEKKHKALNVIGMNLVSTPLCIYKQFKEIDIALPFISQESVLKYYTKFHDEIFVNQSLPCHVSTTRFCNVEQFITFVGFLDVHKMTEDDVDDKSPTAKDHDVAITEEASSIVLYELCKV